MYAYYINACICQVISRIQVCMQTLTHTQTHTHTRARAHACTCTRTRTRIRIRIRALAHSHSHTQTCTLTHTHNCTEDSRLNTAKANHAHVHLRVRVRACAHTHTHTRQLPEHGRSQCEQQWRRLLGAWSCPSLFSSQPTFVVAVWVRMRENFCVNLMRLIVDKTPELAHTQRMHITNTYTHL